MTVPPLPVEYVSAIRSQLGDGADAFLATYEQPATAGLRVNPAKIRLERLRELTGWLLDPIPWCPHGAYVDPEARAGAHPFHAAGLYYLQEPSAMAVVEMAGIGPGQLVLDLAAAPGGKSTQIASALGGQGLLVANEIHAGRVKPLGENLERWGATSTVITSAAPDRLTALGPVFDQVVVDAPCSGEGLFRRDPDARLEWSPARVEGSAERQVQILRSALPVVKPGGALVYSTCTFNERENEQVIARVLTDHAQFRLTGRLRLWPHQVRGEGHTITQLERVGPSETRPQATGGQDEPDAAATWLQFVDANLERDPLAGLPGHLLLRGDRLMLATGHDLTLGDVPVVRDGLWLGDRKPGRFEPSHALALAIAADDARFRLDLDVAEAHRWIAGEPVTAAGPAGWTLVTVVGYPLGWGKRSGSVVKNHYPKGLRRTMRG